MPSRLRTDTVNLAPASRLGVLVLVAFVCVLLPGRAFASSLPFSGNPTTFSSGPGTGTAPPTLGPYLMQAFSSSGSNTDVTSIAGPTGQIGVSPATYDASGSYVNGTSNFLFSQTASAAGGSVTFTMPPGTAAFYVYAGWECDCGGPAGTLPTSATVTATAQDGTTSGPVTVSNHPTYLGFYAAGGSCLQTVTVSVSQEDLTTGAFGIAPVLVGTTCPSVAGALPPTSTQAMCTYVVATAQDTCTATVGGVSAPPTGAVRFSSANGGVFVVGNTCSLRTLVGTANTASCSVQFAPPPNVNLAVTAAYGGDSQHATSNGSTQFILAGQGGNVYASNIQTTPGFSPPSFTLPTLTFQTLDPGSNSTITASGTVEADSSSNGQVCTDQSAVASAAISGHQRAFARAKARRVVVRVVVRHARRGKHRIVLHFSRTQLRRFFRHAKIVTVLVSVKVRLRTGVTLSHLYTVVIGGGHHRTVKARTAQAASAFSCPTLRFNGSNANTFFSLTYTPNATPVTDASGNVTSYNWNAATASIEWKGTSSCQSQITGPYGPNGTTVTTTISGPGSFDLLGNVQLYPTSDANGNAYYQASAVQVPYGAQVNGHGQAGTGYISSLQVPVATGFSVIIGTGSSVAYGLFDAYNARYGTCSSTPFGGTLPPAS